MEAKNLADLYDLPLVDWGLIESRLRDGLSQAPGTGGPDRHTCWLATINPDASMTFAMFCRCFEVTKSLSL